MILETLLGIAAHPVQAPDIKGIELKPKRRREGALINRSTLFSNMPSWKLSPVQSAVDSLRNRLYGDADGRLQLYHTIRGKRLNSLGLMLEMAATIVESRSTSMPLPSVPSTT